MSSSAPSQDRRAHLPAILAVLVGVVVGCWMVLVPPGGQPDEHSHLVRSAALVRRVAELPDVAGGYLVPDKYVVAEPQCYAFQPTVPASCTVVPSPVGDEVVLVTRADDYPWGGHVVFGVAGLLPGLAPVWWGRIAAAAIATGLLTAAMTWARRAPNLSAGALLLGLTPMAWAIVPAVNPSSTVTAGAAALWVSLLAAGRDRALTIGHRALIALAWAAVALPRRDGLIWAALITIVAICATGADLRVLAIRLGGWWSSVVVLSTLSTVVWGLTSDAQASALVVLAPLALVGFEVVRSWWTSRPRSRSATGWAVAICTSIGAAVWLALVTTRPGGWDTSLFLRVIAQTDENLIEAIGVLGWLDTVVPILAVFGWLVLVGMLVGGALPGGRRGLTAAGAVVALAAVTAWTFELLQGNESGTYWQGRYSLPLLIGVPLLLAWRVEVSGEPGRRDLRTLDVVSGVGALVLLNVALWAAARRWGVGTLGSHLPWRWDTAVQPVPVLAILGVHAAATGVLASVLLWWRPDRR